MTSSEQRSDLGEGIAYEVARERLGDYAGAAFRHLMSLKADPAQPASAIEAARAAAHAAQAEVDALRPDDASAIAAILGKS